jgi:KUP system potassium uptake protein
VVPISAGILIALFLIEKYGTSVVGLLFGPVCIAWFLAIGAVGAWNIGQSPGDSGGAQPDTCLDFRDRSRSRFLCCAGRSTTCMTGAEALYADMGHFGSDAIRLAWFGLVAPCLVLNYFGQGALLLVNPEAISNPFYLSFPDWALYPMVGLATAATVIASQATISGAYSMTQQAIQLGYLPRVMILHTSAREFGQIYVPAVNWALFAAVAAAVIGFGSSTALASAYGVAVMGTMLVTTILTFFVVYYGWGFPLWLLPVSHGVVHRARPHLL